MAAPPVIAPADGLSKLPDDLLAHILSFLPAQEAVRTRVLARTWRERDAWKFTRRLFITVGRGSSVLEARDFVDRLLRLRLDGLECASLEGCDIMFPINQDDHKASVIAAVNIWIRRALQCQVQALRVVNDEVPFAAHFYFVIIERLLMSRHLTRLELSGVRFQCIDLNLDGCPALEFLEIRGCELLGVSKIMSPSLKRLVITQCDQTFTCFHRIKISVPRLVSLWLNVWGLRAPLLESMPELVEAYVKIVYFDDWVDHCSCDDPMDCYHVTRAGHISDSDVDNDYRQDTEDYPEENTEGCVLLEGLAQAKDLVLLAHHTRYIFRRDLRWCPTFSKLKTLVLNDYWCKPADCRPLACILQHTPVLEKLTVLFSDEVDPEYDFVLEGRPNATEKSTMISQQLKLVEVKYDTLHEGVHDVLNFLSSLNIWFASELLEVPNEDETTIT